METVQYSDVFRQCTCAPSLVAKYQKISGPLLDRINLHIEAPRLSQIQGAQDIQTAHVAEAIQYRSLDRKLWGA